MSTDLKSAWCGLWERLRAKTEGQPVYGDLVTRYSSAGRAYHTLTHIEECLCELGCMPEIMANRDAIEFAIWFHDAVYVSTRTDNEEQSADLARVVACSAGILKPFDDLVASLIMTTKHAVIPADSDQQILVDIDLAILGQPRPRFDEYEQQIRAEYSWAPSDAFAKGRSAILSSFLGRSRIFSTDFFYRKYEKAARENLARSIAHLRATGGA
jgi:predicted metal-dependent HD superfamily phosphohydrolase